MSDAISRSAVLAMMDKLIDFAYRNEDDELHHTLVTVCAYIDDVPTLDVAPVVRCKNCRYSEPMPDRGVSKFGADALNCTQCRGDDGYGYAGISMIRPDDFCSDGALKDGEPHD